MKRLISLLLSVVLGFGLLTVNAVPVFAEADFTISDECAELLKEMEGFDKYPRWDYSQWTVGHGSRCPDEDLERYRANGITYEEADALLRKHANSFAKTINSFLNKYNLDYTQQQFDALLLFTYNFGTAWMFRETSSWRAGLINGVTGNDFLYEIGQWCHAGDDLLKPLIIRRLIETNIFFNGVYSRTIPDNYCYVIYEFNGGEGETEVQAYDSNLDAPIRVIPTREGYTFAGWYTANEGGAKVMTLDQSTRFATLYARWVEGENADIGDEPVVEPPKPTVLTDPLRVTVTGTDVNVRIGPGTNYSVIGSINVGQSVTITEVTTANGYTWGRFDTDRWIALMYTNYDEIKNQKPEEEVTPEPTPTDPPVEDEPVGDGVNGVVTGSDLRVRTGPGTNYDIVTFLQIGDRVTVTERVTVGTMEWGKTEQGWVSLTYVKLEDDSQQDEQKPSGGTIPDLSTPGNAGDATGTVKVNDFLRIRGGAGTEYEIVGFYGPNARVTILETKSVGSTLWGRTDKGWISLDYIELDEGVSLPGANTGTSGETITGTVVVNDFLRIRSGPGVDYEVVGYLHNGDVVTITETRVVDGTTWGKISSGWISMDYVIID